MSNLELVQHLTEALPQFPELGIVYRGDSQMYAKDSLQRESANYLIFSPKPEEGVEKLAFELHEGVQFALQFSYPDEWPENPLTPITGEFNGYSAYYEQNPSQLPVLSWAQARPLAPQREGIARSGFYARNAFLTRGSILVNGAIAPEDVATIPVTQQNIVDLESTTNVPEVSASIGARLIRWARREEAPNHLHEHLKGAGRSDFHSRMGLVVAHNLIDAATACSQLKN